MRKASKRKPQQIQQNVQFPTLIFGNDVNTNSDDNEQACSLSLEFVFTSFLEMRLGESSTFPYF